MPMQVSWIDPNEVEILLGHLRSPAQPAPSSDEADWPAPGGLLESPEPVPMEASLPAAAAEPAPAEPAPEPSAHPDLDDFRSRLQAIRSRAMGAGLLPTPSAAVPMPPPEEPDEREEESFPEPEAVPEAEAPASPESWPVFEPVGGPVMDRLATLAAWAQPQLRGGHLFVIDDMGELLWGRSNHQHLVLTTVIAWVASSRMSAVFAFQSAPVLRRPMATGGHLLAIPCPTRLGLLHLALTTEEPLADEHVPGLRQALIQAMEAEG